MKKISLLAFVLIMLSNVSFAAGLGAYDAGALNQQYMRDLRTHEFASRAKTKNAIINTTDKKSEKEINNSSDIPVNAIIKSVKFINNNAIASETLNGVVSYAIDRPATSANISEIRRILTKYYQSKGYFSVVIIPQMQELDKGIIIYEIQEGPKNSISVEE